MVDTPAEARNRLARAHINGSPPPEVDEELRSNLATSNLDAAIRKHTYQGRRLDDAQIGHLVGLLLMQSFVDGETVTRVEAYVRQAVREHRAKQAEQ